MSIKYVARRFFLSVVCVFTLMPVRHAYAYEEAPASGCEVPYTISSFEDMVVSIGPLIIFQNLIDLNAVEKLSGLMQVHLAGFIELAYKHIEDGCEVSPSAQKRLDDLTRVLAVMNEVYPKETLKSHDGLMKIFENVKETDPGHTERLRIRDWSKPL